MKKLAIVFGVAVGLAGCVSSGSVGKQDLEQVRAVAATQRAECIAKLKQKQFKTFAAYGRCLADADAPVAAGMGTFSDLFYVRNAKRTAVYERLDRREITPIQADAEVAQLNSDLIEQIERRSNQQRAVLAQEQAALAAWKPVTCTRVYNSVSCF